MTGTSVAKVTVRLYVHTSTHRGSTTTILGILITVALNQFNTTPTENDAYNCARVFDYCLIRHEHLILFDI